MDDSYIYKDAKLLYDIPYLSRHNHSEELVEMERFIRTAAAEGLACYLLGLSYDSNASFCEIETTQGLTAEDPAGERLVQIASLYISQFHLFGAIGHRGSAGSC
ncbi:hypothetical protein ACSC9U_05025 [Pseudomonas solani]|uniref:hypothetical protein n=1 Tax=Pseudomonas solani TaxID=2731552 RepID=UPI003F4AEA1F